MNRVKEVNPMLTTYSFAEQIFDLGRTLAHVQKCNCKTCKAQEKVLQRQEKQETLDLARAWHKYCDKHPGDAVRSMVDGWDEAKISATVSQLA